MLEVELDVFSGMPNPTWTLSDSDERELIDRITAEPTQLSPVASEDEQFSLGYRGLVVRMIKTNDDRWSQARLSTGESLPLEFRVGSKPATTAPVADWLLDTSTSTTDSGVTDELRELAAAGVVLVQPAGAALGPTDISDPGQLTEEGADAPSDADSVEELSTYGRWWACGSNYFNANAAVFNRPEYISRNNCYCFASNHLANVRYALPGRRGGHPASSITCGGVIDGLRADGWKEGCEPNSLTIALVIWPGVDYHFYRLVTGGPYWWWGHKPGATPAKYTDDCGHSIYQYQGKGWAPNNICRGHYTDFCGYFYQNNSTAFVA